ncbi:hypothetical protein J7T55_008353 [Diaporthe amygdali]|uniref:uncharacterized protein n=1 Tax=Phomopsis amygdali TaxID=1214568 RepID=UPI0022FF02D9|nr:uncharacterized protein J7T55_008353 [Diaporthe amygdali]KAJ0121190.1 hypothetical protein J7T55_008353 [Diaporthe amygdali]
MSNTTDDPNDPSSFLSKKARLAHWITGGTNRGPSTMSSFNRMVKDRNDFKKASQAWALAQERGLDEHQGRWGRSGLPGAVDEARGTAPKPRGMALVRWFRENGGAGDGRIGRGEQPGEAAAQPAQQQQERQQQTGPIEDDIYGASDDAGTTEGDNTGDGDTAARTVTEITVRATAD